MLRNSARLGVALAVAVLAVVLVQPAAAGTYLNTIDDTAAVSPAGHHVVVTGPIGCDAGEVVELRVRVTQPSTDVVAVGTSRARCTGDVQGWTVHATTRGSGTLEPGDAHVQAWARTYDGGVLTDGRSWGRDVTLVRR